MDAEDSVRLSGAQYNDLSEMLVTAFPARNDLRRAVRIYLDERLDDIAPASNLRDTVDELLVWAEARNKVALLVRGVCLLRPERADLRTLAVAIGVRLTTAAPTPPLSPHTERSPQRHRVRFEPPLPLRDAADQRAAARQGFIGFVALYQPQVGSEALALSPTARQAAIDTSDYRALDVEHSNLWPMIYAIRCHATRLEHCWLLSTPQSRPYAPIMVAYLQEEAGLTACHFHYQEEYYIINTQTDEVLLFDKAYRTVLSVQQEAQALNIPRRAMIADCTTGVRSMTIGMILACLGEDQDVEVVGSQFTDDNQPTGQLLPLIFRFRPEVSEQS